MPRPRIHPNNAEKQFAYRQRLREKLQHTQNLLADLHHLLRFTTLRGETPCETLANLVHWLSQATSPNATAELLTQLLAELLHNVSQRTLYDTLDTKGANTDDHDR